LSEHRYRALWPGGASAVTLVQPAARPRSLAGKRVGFLWDQMFRGDEIFPLLERELAKQFPEIEFVSEAEFGPTFGGDEHAVIEALPMKLSALKVDAVISGIGA
jgi:hypothetical protein